MSEINPRLRLLWLCLGFSLLALIIYLSLTSSPPNLIKFHYSDKLGHFVAYLTLMAWFGQLYKQRLHLFLLAVVFVGMGVGLEILQGLSGQRFFEFADMLANSVGVLVGWWLTLTLLSGMLIKLERRVSFPRCSF